MYLENESVKNNETFKNNHAIFVVIRQTLILLHI